LSKNFLLIYLNFFNQTSSLFFREKNTNIEFKKKGELERDNLKMNFGRVDVFIVNKEKHYLNLNKKKIINYDFLLSFLKKCKKK
jgi:hypothetical protein